MFVRGSGGLCEACREEETRHTVNQFRETNDLMKSDKTMRKVRKWAEVIKELHYTENIQIVFSSIILRTDKDFGNKIKLRSYCLGKGFVFVDNDSIN